MRLITLSYCFCLLFYFSDAAGEFAALFGGGGGGGSDSVMKELRDLFGSDTGGATADEDNVVDVSSGSEGATEDDDNVVDISSGPVLDIPLIDKPQHGVKPSVVLTHGDNTIQDEETESGGPSIHIVDEPLDGEYGSDLDNAVTQGSTDYGSATSDAGTVSTSGDVIAGGWSVKSHDDNQNADYDKVNAPVAVLLPDGVQPSESHANVYVPSHDYEAPPAKVEVYPVPLPVPPPAVPYNPPKKQEPYSKESPAYGTHKVSQGLGVADLKNLLTPSKPTQAYVPPKLPLSKIEVSHGNAPTYVPPKLPLSKIEVSHGNAPAYVPPKLPLSKIEVSHGNAPAYVPPKLPLSKIEVSHGNAPAYVPPKLPLSKIEVSHGNAPAYVPPKLPLSKIEVSHGNAPAYVPPKLPLSKIEVSHGNAPAYVPPKLPLSKIEVSHGNAPAYVPPKLPLSKIKVSHGNAPAYVPPKLPLSKIEVSHGNAPAYVPPKLPLSKIEVSHGKTQPILHKILSVPKPTPAKLPVVKVLPKQVQLVKVPPKKLYAVGATAKSIIPVHGPGYFPRAYTGYFPGADEFSYKAGYKQVYTKMPSVPPKPTSGCPYGWLPYDGHCYLFSSDKTTWFTASMKCRYMGGYLTVVDNPAENSFIKLISHKYGYKKNAWFGLNDVLFNKIFMWEGGNKQCRLWDWGKGEPILKGMGYRHCVALGKDCDFQWVVNNCHERNYYICEFVPGKPCQCDY